MVGCRICRHEVESGRDIKPKRVRFRVLAVNWVAPLKQAIVIVFILNSSVLFGQEVKRVVTTFPKSKDLKELYYVLRSNKDVKQGAYYSFYKGELTTDDLKGKDLEKDVLGFRDKGQYDQNHKSGHWITYHAPRVNSATVIYGSKQEEGAYANDKKVGVWKEYIENGQVVKQFDFDSNSALPTLVSVHGKYPSAARKNGIEGRVKLKVTYENCEATDYQVLEDIGYGCGDAAIETLKAKRVLEKKYGVASDKCDVKEEIIEKQFILAK